MMKHYPIKGVEIDLSHYVLQYNALHVLHRNGAGQTELHFATTSNNVAFLSCIAS